jgi:hypothetical protein
MKINQLLTDAAGGPTPANPFGAMVNQLSNTGPTSSGGQLTATPTGQQHTAGANNPNQPSPSPAPAPAPAPGPTPSPSPAPAPAPAPGPTPSPSPAPAPGPTPKSGGFLKGVGNVIQGTGNIASQLVGSTAQTVGAAAGGFKRGFNTSYGGDTFRMPTTPVSQGLNQASNSQIHYQHGQNVAQQGDNFANSQQQLDDLKTMIQRMDQRLTGAGIRESKKN